LKLVLLRNPTSTYRRFRPLHPPAAIADFPKLIWTTVKQHLRIKVFYGTSQNAVKAQIWVAISIYVLIAIVKKRHELEPSLFQILQILSITIFEKVPIPRAFGEVDPQEKYLDISNQLNLLGL